MIIQNIDKGNPFDWGKTSEDYAKYRDIYPQEFYDYILALGLCKNGQKVLDIGTGTGVLPRNMYKYGAEWVGTDIAENQIEQAKRIADDAGMNIDFFASKAEEVSFPDETFDVITACRGVGASMSPADLESWDKEHYKMPEGAAPESFTVKHYVSIAELQKSERTDSV